MAKKPNKAKLIITAPTQPKLSTAAKNEDEQYRLRDDADKIKRYAELRGDKARHSAAISHINSEHQAIQDLSGGLEEPSDIITPRGIARQGRRRASRRIGGRR
jgi:hypothetical protein